MQRSLMRIAPSSGSTRTPSSGLRGLRRAVNARRQHLYLAARRTSELPSRFIEARALTFALLSRMTDGRAEPSYGVGAEHGWQDAGL